MQKILEAILPGSQAAAREEAQGNIVRTAGSAESVDERRVKKEKMEIGGQSHPMRD